MPARANYDAIVIGGGHHGLVTAAYLARGGRRVCVVERRAVLGGAATTEELWPGFKISTLAKPGMVLKNFSWTSSGREVERPLGYHPLTVRPSGSKKIWWELLSGNLTILSSMEGQ